MRRLRGHRDEGFSMIEVIVAIVILGIVASSALWFFINGMQTSSNLNRQQTAVTIATSTIENSYALDPRKSPTVGVSGLVIGRSSADVNAAFAFLAPRLGGLRGGLGIDGVADTYPLSDPAGGTPLLPIKSNPLVTRAGVDYTVYTLVGSCYRKAATNGSAQPCAKAAFFPNTEPSTLPVGSARLLRIIVVVTWAPIGDECGTNRMCSYDVATLVDPSLDLAWNRVIKPVALPDDKFSFAPGDAGYDLDVMDNDVLGSVRSWPVQLVPGSPLNPSAGTVTTNSNGTIKYTPPAGNKANWVSGIFTFNYRVFDRSGASSEAKVSLKLKPTATGDAFSATVTVPQQLDVLANDLGSPALITIVDPPSKGTISITSGTVLTYTGTVKGNDSFSYKYSDSALQESPVVPVTVRVDSVTAVGPTVKLKYVTDATAADSWQNISGNLRGTNPAATKIIITGLPKASSGSTGTGSLRIDGTLYSGGTVTGTVVEFQPPANASKEWTFPFKVTLGGYDSPDPAAIAVMQVPAVPTAVNDDLGGQKKSTSLTIAVNNNDLPSTWPSDGVTKLTLGTVPGGCGSTGATTAANLAAGQVKLTLPGSKKDSCDIPYTLTYGSNTSVGHITYNVTN